METKLRKLIGGEIAEAPGYWMITEQIEGENREWNVIRKPDGTYWEVQVDLFPGGGLTARFNVGEQIIHKALLAQCQANYAQLLEQQAVEAGWRMLVLFRCQNPNCTIYGRPVEKPITRAALRKMSQPDSTDQYMCDTCGQMFVLTPREKANNLSKLDEDAMRAANLADLVS